MNANIHAIGGSANSAAGTITAQLELPAWVRALQHGLDFNEANQEVTTKN